MTENLSQPLILMDLKIKWKNSDLDILTVWYYCKTSFEIVEPTNAYFGERFSTITNCQKMVAKTLKVNIIGCQFIEARSCDEL
jgi:hypothetical protein